MKYGNILAIDDNNAILTALKLCLGDTFQDIITLLQPDDILTIMAQEEIEAVILDMNFSLGINTGHDGIFWLQAIKKHHPNVPVILLTAYADVQLAVKGLKNGAADFVTKPWDNDELLRKIKDAIDKSRSLAPLSEVEADHVQRAIDSCHGNLSKAADMLGVSRQTLYNKMKTK